VSQKNEFTLFVVYTRLYSFLRKRRTGLYRFCFGTLRNGGQ
jgi:hypothetical protein